MIPVEKELEHAHLYVEIRRMQFGDRVSVVMDVADEVLELMTVKVILQPFVENVYRHALAEGRSVTIWIRAFVLGQALYFHVEDNGCGMSPEEMEQVVEGQGGGYAVLNVQRRIRLRFGKSYGVEMRTGSQGGLLVILRLPVIRMEEG